MAYQSSYAAPMYPPTPQAPFQHPPPHHQQHFYPNTYPYSATPSPSYPTNPHPQASTENQVHELQNVPDQYYGTGAGAAMPPPSMLPDDPFKKPYPPNQRLVDQRQHYVPNAQSSPVNQTFSQQQSTSASSSAAPLFSPTQSQSPIKPPLPSASSMPTTIIPTTSTTSTQSTPTSEAAPQPPPQNISNSLSSPSEPLSPLDSDRVAALLNLNTILLKELSAMRTMVSKPSLASPTDPSPTPSATENTSTTTVSPTPSSTQTTAIPLTTKTPTSPATIKLPTPSNPQKPVPTHKQKYENYMRRLHVNIAYLLSVSQAKPVPTFPSVMESPPESWFGTREGEGEGLKEAYARLRELWPDWRPGVRQQVGGIQQGAQQAQAQVVQQQP